MEDSIFYFLIGFLGSSVLVLANKKSNSTTVNLTRKGSFGSDYFPTKWGVTYIPDEMLERIVHRMAQDKNPPNGGCQEDK